MAEDEREAMERGRSLVSKSCSLESSQSASLVSIRSRSSSISASDFPESIDDQDDVVVEEEDGEEESAIFSFVKTLERSFDVGILPRLRKTPKCFFFFLKYIS